MINITFDCASLDPALGRYWSVEFDVDPTNFREDKFPLLSIDGEPTLRVGEGVIPVSAFESRVTRLLAPLDTSEKVLEGLVNSPQHILENLRMDAFQKAMGLFGGGQLSRLIQIGDRAAVFFPLVLSFRKGIIIQNTAGHKPLGKKRLLLFGRIQAEFVGALHATPYRPYGFYPLWSLSRCMKRPSSSVYNLNYHIVWCPRYRKPILVGKIKTFLEDQIKTIAATKNWEVLELQVMPDHIHLFISTPPSESPVGIVKVLKGVTGLRLFKKYPELKEEYWKGHIWSPSYYVGTAGHVSAETIRNYIESQKGM